MRPPLCQLPQDIEGGKSLPKLSQVGMRMENGKSMIAYGWSGSGSSCVQSVCSILKRGSLALYSFV
jgi:predicted ABC-type transport system involved in lysophospholipase L1 biosynthesis ATPase subunit